MNYLYIYLGINLVIVGHELAELKKRDISYPVAYLTMLILCGLPFTIGAIIGALIRTHKERKGTLRIKKQRYKSFEDGYPNSGAYHFYSERNCEYNLVYWNKETKETFNFVMDDEPDLTIDATHYCKSPRVTYR